MWYVYIIRSDSDPGKRYIGLTQNPQERLAAHNAGRSPHTARHTPWHLETITGFDNKAKALAFERYLKSGSGFAFAKRHF